MKVRQGFVSNSSTSSFFVWGDEFNDIGDLKKKLKPEMLKELEADWKKTQEKYKDDEDDEEITFEKYLSGYADLIHSYEYNEDSFIFGIRAGSIDYQERVGTIKEFIKEQEEAQKLFDKYFGKRKGLEVALWGIRSNC